MIQYLLPSFCSSHVILEVTLTLLLFQLRAELQNSTDLLREERRRSAQERNRMGYSREFFFVLNKPSLSQRRKLASYTVVGY